MSLEARYPRVRESVGRMSSRKAFGQRASEISWVAGSFETWTAMLPDLAPRGGALVAEADTIAELACQARLDLAEAFIGAGQLDDAGRVLAGAVSLRYDLERPGNLGLNRRSNPPLGTEPREDTGEVALLRMARVFKLKGDLPRAKLWASQTSRNDPHVAREREAYQAGR